MCPAKLSAQHCLGIQVTQVENDYVGPVCSGLCLDRKRQSQTRPDHNHKGPCSKCPWTCALQTSHSWLPRRYFLKGTTALNQGTSRPSSFQLSHCATRLHHITLPRPLNLSASISSPTTGGYIITVSFQRGF